MALAHVGTTPTYTVDTPTFISPVSGATLTSNTVTLLSSAFATSPAQTGVVQTSASWFLYTDAALTQIAQQSLNDTVNLNSITFNNLSPGTTYYATVYYTDSNAHVSATSASVSFSTPAAAVIPPAPTPAVVFDGRISTLPLAGALTGNELVPIIKNNENLAVLLSSISTATSGGVSVAGNLSVYASSVNTYLITNYSINQTYTVSASVGSAVLSGDTITYTAGSTTGPATLTVNNKAYGLTIIPNIVQAPTITSPVNGATIYSSTVTLQSSTFASTLTTETQQSATWQLATDAAFTQIFSTSINSITNLTSWTVSGVQIGTTYYARVQYTGQLSGTSAFSPTVSFSIAQATMPVAQSQLITIQNEATNSALTNANFGALTSTNQNATKLVIGAANLGAGANNAYGAAFIYTLNGSGYTQTAELFPPTAYKTISNYFSISVAMSSDGLTAAASDNGSISSTNNGYVCIYTYNGTSWTLIQTLTSPNQPNTSGLYGTYGVKIAFANNNQLLFVSDSQYFLSSQNSLVGCICVYSLQNGQYVLQTILNPGYSNLAALPDQFYTNYSVFGNYFDVSSDGTMLVTPGTIGGTFYVFTQSGGVWTNQYVAVALTQTLSNNKTLQNNNFAADLIRLDSTKTRIALTQNTTANLNTVFIFNLSAGAWNLYTTITDPNNANNYSIQFGSGLSFGLNSNQLFIGDPNAVSGTNYGVVYLYDLSSTTPSLLNSYTQNPSASYSNNFGNNITYNPAATKLFVNAYNTTVGSVSSEGAVFVYQ